MPFVLGLRNPLVVVVFFYLFSPSSSRPVNVPFPLFSIGLLEISLQSHVCHCSISRLLLVLLTGLKEVFETNVICVSLSPRAIFTCKGFHLLPKFSKPAVNWPGVIVTVDFLPGLLPCLADSFCHLRKISNILAQNSVEFAPINYRSGGLFVKLLAVSCNYYRAVVTTLCSPVCLPLTNYYCRGNPQISRGVCLFAMEAYPCGRRGCVDDFEFVEIDRLS